MGSAAFAEKFEDSVDGGDGYRNESRDEEGYGHARPAFRVGDRSEPVRAERATDVAAAVQNPREHTRIETFAKSERRDRSHNMIRAVREEHYYREADKRENIKRRTEQTHYDNEKSRRKREIQSDVQNAVGDQRMEEYAGQRAEHSEYGEHEREKQRQAVAQPERFFHYRRDPRLQAVLEEVDDHAETCEEHEHGNVFRLAFSGVEELVCFGAFSGLRYGSVASLPYAKTIRPRPPRSRFPKL